MAVLTAKGLSASYVALLKICRTFSGSEFVNISTCVCEKQDLLMGMGRVFECKEEEEREGRRRKEGGREGEHSS